MTCFPIAGVVSKESQIATASVLIQVKNNRVKIDMLLPLAEGASRYVAAGLASMMTATQPFPLPRQPPPMLARIHQYWKTLIRAENPMPFSDDVSLGSIEKLSAHIMLVEVFSGPQRFRFNRLGGNVIDKLGNDLTGQFADEIKPTEPLNYFIAQASATIEAGAPTLYAAARGKSWGRG